MTRFRKVAFWILGGLGALSLVLTGPMLVQGIKEKQAVDRRFEQYAALLVAGELREAYQFCGRDFREATTLEEFLRQQEALAARYGKLLRVRRTDYEVKGRGSPLRWTAQVTAEFEFGTKTIGFLYELHKEQDQWVIYGYEQASF